MLAARTGPSWGSDGSGGGSLFSFCTCISPGQFPTARHGVPGARPRSHSACQRPDCLPRCGPRRLWPVALLRCAPHIPQPWPRPPDPSPSRVGPLPAPHCARGAPGRSALLPSLDSGQFPGELLALPADLLSRHCFTLDGFQVTELTELSSSSSMAWTPHPGTRTSSQPRRPDYVLPLRAAASPAEQHGAIRAPSA